MDALHHRHQRHVAAGAQHLRPPELGPLEIVVDLLLDAVQTLMFEEQHRVIVLDRGLQQRFGVGRVRRAHDLQPRDVLEPGAGSL